MSVKTIKIVLIGGRWDGQEFSCENRDELWVDGKFVYGAAGVSCVGLQQPSRYIKGPKKKGHTQYLSQNQ